MINLSGNISTSLNQSSQVDNPVSSSKGSITLKINGLQYFFDPSKQAAQMKPQAAVSNAGKPLVIQTFFALRQETSSVEESDKEDTVYRIELNESSNLDSEEEFSESLEEEEDEESDDIEDMPSENSPSMQEGEGFSEEDSKESLNECLLIQEAVKEERAKKTWEKAKIALLESLERKAKRRFVLSQSFETLSYLSLIKK